VELVFPSGATGLSTNSMVEDEYSFTLRVIGTRGEAFVHNFVKPHGDDRLTLRTQGGTTVEHHGTRSSYSYQLEAFADHVLHGKPLPLDLADAVANMALIDDAYRAAGMAPR
jgi:predicted dehydrogenase